MPLIGCILMTLATIAIFTIVFIATCSSDSPKNEKRFLLSEIAPLQSVEEINSSNEVHSGMTLGFQ